MQLSPEDDPETILAHMGKTSEGKLTLIVSKVAEAFIDEIIAAIIFIEHWMRNELPDYTMVNGAAASNAAMGVWG